MAQLHTAMLTFWLDLIIGQHLDLQRGCKGRPETSDNRGSLASVAFRRRRVSA